MDVRGITPILNVSDIDASATWFGGLGWELRWRWNGFAGIHCGAAELFLCEGGQGARGRPATEPFDEHTGGVWMTWWLPSPADVDAAHERALALGCEINWPPTDEPWGVREFHLRHPDGHTFRVSAGLE